jgi:DNA polymerase elongation subunit (family B)
MRRTNSLKMTDIQKVIEKINKKPYIIKMGAGKIANWLGVSPESVREAKKLIYRESIMQEVPEHKLKPHQAPKILLLDIETAPLRAYVWRTWKQNIYLDQLISDWFMITWAAKWLLEDEVLSQRLTPEEILVEQDGRIVETLWHLLNQADVVIAHNGKTFDIPKIKSRFLLHGLPPTTFYQQVDTLEVAKREFGFSSNKLEGLARTFGIEGKSDTDFTLWSACMSGDNDALKYMELYNRQDVKVLEEVYLIMRPYIKAHPNYNLYIDSAEPVCPHCGCKELTFVGYYYFTQTGKYKNFRCNSCGALSRERKSILSNSKSILVSNGK